VSDFLHPLSARERCSRYRVRLLCDPRAVEEGIRHGDDEEGGVVPWDTFHGVLAAEVGEPEGVRTIVFDLYTISDGGVEVHRLDAEPGEEAMELARRIELYLGAGRESASLKSVATDGIPTSWHPDLESFEEQALSQVEASR
jgi:hypothetical protein